MNILFKTSGGELRWGWRAILLIGGTMLFGIALNSVLIIGYSSRGLAREQAMEQAMLASEGFVPQTVMSVLQLGFMLWLVRLLVIRIENQRFDWSKLGLIPGNRSKHIWLGIILAVALSLLPIGIGYFAGVLKYAGNGFELFNPSQIFVTLLLGAVLALASGFGEEIVFRGYLQSCIAARYNPASAIVIVSVLFAFSHPIGTVINPVLYLVTAILVGVLFGTIFARTGSLWMGIALHTVWNHIQIAVLAVNNTADERFFNAPLFVFENNSDATQNLIEFGVVVIGFLASFWLTRPVPTEIDKEKSWTLVS